MPKGIEPCKGPQAYGNISFKKYKILEQACSTQSSWKKKKYRKEKGLIGSSILVKIPADNARHNQMSRIWQISALSFQWRGN
jgi:hypothetical protein